MMLPSLEPDANNANAHSIIMTHRITLYDRELSGTVKLQNHSTFVQKIAKNYPHFRES